ncbi:arylsulfatase A-like enzyme [Pseudomonas citronellolis]|uniref:alkaline phosphatase family protein n=1 Tax=Pseudomonas citronellolis TaxID=53408 RepID=UPI0020A06B3E|nr:alkaline phosphatase family protein [Pseudomonas citronellolis]MCP1643202.1 arylsulfatase A-like enzyme [Pseudomonas citronellolis]MCP1666128.1 arylsulfatase A-like enzyme [Pseudomonas citronellolis]MCP1698141.1 arylsulfatase A-like enzyme [Pseudomonas citronellolis]MCP1703875.1 arylsulfatase A-like enzyme [Pseudomonas citronellolis]MCP1797775.1 arylsulfatase A-like enzyme [Pseudomonas citronellolis]
MSQPQPIRNVLYIMCDQLRRDYLSCYGHPHLHTPNIDRLAAEGVRFARAYTQGTICGPSRMSSYTGRYVSSHQVSWNAVPLPLEELTLGDYLRPAGIRTALVGKTHATANLEGMQALGVDPQSERGQQLAEAGFEPYDRNDGIYPDGELFADKRESAPYTHYLRGLGYAGDNPWHDWANAAEGANGEVLSGWQMRNAGLPTRLPEPHSETVYATSRAIDFMREQGDEPWCLHLSYIKPHWPYIAPAPYHALYGPGQVLPALRAAPGEESEHPVYKAFQQHQESLNFSREEVRNTVIPTYMGLIRQIDDQLGRLFEHMQSSGRWDDTLIVFTSDHGDYLGDHGLGEKEFLLEPAVGVPLLIRDPRAAADASRGTVEQALVQSIDVLPTLLDAFALPPAAHRVEGRSLQPLLHGQRPADWRDYAIAEYDYAFQAPARERLGRPIDACRMYMVRSERWKYLAYDGFRPQLFDLQADPGELRDLGAEPACADVREQHQRYLFDWLRGLKRRTTISNEEIDLRGQAFRYGEPEGGKLVRIGEW